MTIKISTIGTHHGPLEIKILICIWLLHRTRKQKYDVLDRYMQNLKRQRKLTFKQRIHWGVLVGCLSSESFHAINV